MTSQKRSARAAGSTAISACINVVPVRGSPVTNIGATDGLVGERVAPAILEEFQPDGEQAAAHRRPPARRPSAPIPAASRCSTAVANRAGSVSSPQSESPVRACACEPAAASQRPVSTMPGADQPEGSRPRSRVPYAADLAPNRRPAMLPYSISLNTRIPASQNPFTLCATCFGVPHGKTSGSTGCRPRSQNCDDLLPGQPHRVEVLHAAPPRSHRVLVSEAAQVLRGDEQDDRLHHRRLQHLGDLVVVTDQTDLGHRRSDGRRGRGPHARRPHARR